MAHVPDPSTLPAPSPTTTRRPRTDERPAEVPVHRVSRRPNDGWVLADPVSMGASTRRALRGIIAGLCPLGSGHAPADMIDRVEDQVRRLLAYLPPLLARGFLLATWILELAPLWRLRAPRRLHKLPRAEGARLLSGIGRSRWSLLRDVTFTLRAAVLSAYFDQPDVQQAIGYDAVSWIEQRVALRKRIVAEGVDAVAPVPVAPALGATP